MPKNKQVNKKKLTLLGIGCGVLVVSVILVLEITNTTYIFHKKVSTTLIPTTSSTTPTNSSNTPSTSSDQGTNTDAAATASDSKQPSASTNSASVTLIAPYGNFVSNHYPGQNGSDLKEVSLCSTSPGATCYIKFTQGSVVKLLPEKTADQSGSTVWEWNISDAGLTSGEWKIEAVAKLGSQTESTTDQLRLEVQ